MKNRHAFTLVELLTVIVIIGILAAIITVAVAGAFRASQMGRIGVQMSQIAMALDRYNSEFGEFPPDMFDDEALVRHVRKRWPRLNLAAIVVNPGDPIPLQAERIRSAINATYIARGYTTVDFTLSEVGALALWLGGFPNSDGILSGFNADPAHPFAFGDTFDGKVFIDLELGEGKNVRLFPVGGGTNPPTVPVIGNEIRGTFVPIVYFRGRAGGGPDAYLTENRSGTGTNRPERIVKHFNFTAHGFGICVPYIESGNLEDRESIRWKNPTTYQLIHPGLDGSFGETEPRIRRVIRTGDGISLADLDNLTNFSDNRELRSILP